MSTKEKSPKDAWDKIDIGVKLFSSLVLAAIALILQRSASEISFSIQKAQLLNNLVEGLSTKKQDESGKRDLSLMTLEYTFGEKEKKLVADIAERVYKNIDDLDPEARETAKGIITRYSGLSRMEELEKKVNQKILEKANKDKESTTSAPISSSDSSKISEKQSSQAEQKKAETLAQLVESQFQNIVYIQFKTDSLRPSAEKLRKKLQSAKFNTPGIQKIEGKFGDEIRYFHEEDKDLAIRVMSLSTQFFADQSLPKTFKLVALTGTKFKAPKGQVEIWIR